MENDKPTTDSQEQQPQTQFQEPTQQQQQQFQGQLEQIQNQQQQFQDQQQQFQEQQQEQLQEEQQPENNNQSGSTEGNVEASAGGFDGPVTKVEGTDSPSLNDGSAADNSEDTGIVDRQTESELNTSDTNQTTFANPEDGDIGENIVSGARQTDQLERMQENAEENPAPAEEKEGGPSIVKINNGEPDEG
jgi:type II secretory pathway pseudopilin PulG